MQLHSPPDVVLAPRWRPTPDELLLLRAATLARQPALAAWQRWRQRVDPDHAGAHCQLLYPLVWRNLAGDLQGDPLQETLAGEYRRIWTQNQFLHRRAAGAIQALHGEGLQTLVLKGAALGALYYGDVGVRPMGDVDLLVPRENLAAAVAILTEQGWAPFHADFERHLCAIHAENFSEPSGGQIDLHWQALFFPGRDEPTWQAAVPVQLAGQPTRAPCPADQLLHVCVHGTMLDQVAGMRWIADALAVLRHGVNWTRFIQHTAQRRLSVSASTALGLLAREFPGSVPPHVLQQLAALRCGLIENWAQRLALRSPALPGRLMLDLDRYARTRRLHLDTDAAVSFPRYVRHTHRLDGWRQLTRHSARKAIEHQRQRQA